MLIEVLEPGYPALGENQRTMEIAEGKERDAREGGNGKEAPLTLEYRIANAANKLAAIVGPSNVDAEKIDKLRRFVGARLTASELRSVAAGHRDLRVYTVWRSSQKKKLTSRSMRPLKCDAGLMSFSANGNGITWAVLDTGILGAHPHFKDVITSVWGCTKQGPPIPVDVRSARDPDGHGTHVAGIIAGKAPKLRNALRSERGPTADGRVKPDCVAPGERISSCNSRYRGADEDLYCRDSGTSMAAPHVSGLLAAFLSVRREFRGRPDEVKEILLKSCIDIGRDRYHPGHGIPNLMQMLLSV